MFEIQQNLALSTYNSTLFQTIIIVKNLILIFMVLSDILRLYQFAINMKDIYQQMAQQWETNKGKTDKILTKHCRAWLNTKQYYSCEQKVRQWEFLASLKNCIILA